MDSIVACRDTISERFPVASFTVNVPEARLFEIVCATDPRLLHTDNATRRTPANFFSSRIGGLLPARRGANTYILPAEQLRRFAGARRLYYALGTYAGPRGEQPRFSVAPDALDRVPCMRMAADFTGHSLDRRRLGVTNVKTDANYGGRERPVLRWGGDAVLEAQRTIAMRVPQPAVPTSRSQARYDDGFDPSLWSRGAESGSGSGSQFVAYGGAAPGIAYEDAASLRADRRPPPDQRYGGQGGAAVLEDGAQAHARALARPLAEQQASRYGRAQPSTNSQIDARTDALEDGAQAWASGRARQLEHRPARPDRYDTTPDRYGAAPARYHDAAPARTSSSFEDAAQLRAQAPTLARPLASARQSSPRTREQRAYGRRDANDERGDPSARRRSGRHPEYREQALEQSLPIGPAVHPLGDEPVSGANPPVSRTTPPRASGRALSVADKVRILRVVAQAESGDDGYAAVFADVEFNDPEHPFYRRTHLGLSWGLLAFTQRSGALGRVLALAKAREDAMLADSTALPAAHRFESLFGEQWPELLERTDALRHPDPDERLLPVAGSLLWEQPWLDRFRAAGAVPHIQAAQNQVGVEAYFDAIIPLARALELRTARDLAVLVDRVVHMGVGAGTAWIMDAAGPITSEALREQALAALGFAGDLVGFARSRKLDDRGWTPIVHAGLLEALRGLEQSPIVLPSQAVVIGRINAAIADQPERDRVRALLDPTRDEFDDAVMFDL